MVFTLVPDELVRQAMHLRQRLPPLLHLPVQFLHFLRIDQKRSMLKLLPKISICFCSSSIWLGSIFTSGIING